MQNAGAVRGAKNDYFGRLKYLSEKWRFSKSYRK